MKKEKITICKSIKNKPKNIKQIEDEIKRIKKAIAENRYEKVTYLDIL